MNTIKIGEKERPIKFGIYAFKLYAQLKGITVDDVFSKLEKFGTEEIMTLSFCGFKYGAMKQGVDIDFTEDDIWMWVDENPEILERIMLVLSESMPQADKKKVSKEKS